MAKVVGPFTRVKIARKKVGRLVTHSMCRMRCTSVQRNSAVTCYTIKVSWLEVPMPASLCTVQPITVQLPSCLLECRKEGAPGWDKIGAHHWCKAQ